MNISWVFSNNAKVKKQHIEKLKDIGSTWGGWKTWKTCKTDNAICHEHVQSKFLIGADFHKNCNFYVPESMRTENIVGLNFFGGEFQHEMIDHEEIIALHLASINSDIVLLYGFAFSAATDKKVVNYQGLFREAIKASEDVQWVLIDTTVPEFLMDLPNLTSDTLKNVLKLLSS